MIYLTMDSGHCTLDSCCKSLVEFVPYVHLSVSSRQVKGDKNWFGFLHTRARLHEVSRGRQVKGLMIKVGAKITGDLISSSSLFSFTRGWSQWASSPQRRQITGGASWQHTFFSPSSPSDSTLSLQLDGKQFIGLLPHGNALLWFPHWSPTTSPGPRNFGY